MSDLVLIKNENRQEVPITTSELIAEFAKVQHHTITKLIQTHEKSLENFGKLRFNIEPLSSGQKVKVYFLNEMQSTLLITFLKNTQQVIEFKVELVKQFYTMRQLIQEKQTTEWKHTREISKDFNKELGDTIQNFESYARSQGSKNYRKYYGHFSNLANTAIRIETGKRDFSNTMTLTAQNYVISLIKRTIEFEMLKGTFYREIYQICKREVTCMIGYIMPRQLTTGGESI